MSGGKHVWTANGGTLFLDVGELPAETQIALLRVLQEHESERVGGTRPMRTDARVIAVTNRDLQASTSAGSFRRDLFYRLHVFPIDSLRKVQYRTLILLTVLRYHSSIRSNLGFERRGRRQKSGGSVPAPIGESGKLLNPGGSR